MRIRETPWHTIVFVSILLTFGMSSCKLTSQEYALEWSQEIKSKIMEDVRVKIDSVVTDTSDTYIEYIEFTEGTRVKEFSIRIATRDTIGGFYYSHDQNFKLCYELCPDHFFHFEGLFYKGKSYGLAEFKFCDGRLKESGFKYEGRVGIWNEWNEDGSLKSTIDNGEAEKLEGLRKIKYWR